MPEFSCLQRGLFSLIPIESKQVHIASIDRYWRVYWNPEAFAELTLVQAASVLVHELWHRLHKHGERAVSLGVSAQTHDLWNVVIDASIHENSGALIENLRSIKKVVGEEFRPAERANFPVELPAGRVAEVWYDMLLQSIPKLSIEFKPGEGAGSEHGSGASSVTAKWELPPGSKAPKISPEEAKAIARSVADAIQQQASRGNVPAGWERWAKEAIVPQKDWTSFIHTKLGSLTASALAMHRWTYTKPSRRHNVEPRIVMPGWVGNSVSVAFLLDTSGSVTDRWLGLAISQIRLAISRLAANRNIPAVQVYSCDAAASHASKIWDVTQLKLIGGGGTDMRVGMSQIEQDRKKYRYDVQIVVTDGDTPWPEVPPSIPTLIILFESSQKQRAGVPAWAEAHPHACVSILT
jgi:predicted metal-dependent peptidase